jgi:hypothetical protein
MIYAIYPTRAAAEEALAAINPAYLATVREVRVDGIMQPLPPITQWWADPIECAEGWAFLKPNCSQICTLLGEHTEAESIT